MRGEEAPKKNVNICLSLMMMWFCQSHRVENNVWWGKLGQGYGDDDEDGNGDDDDDGDDNNNDGDIYIYWWSVFLSRKMSTSSLESPVTTCNHP